MKPRTEDEADMLRDGVSKPEENCCGNCGWAFLPYNPENEDRYRYCSHWETTKPIGYWDRPWRHTTKVFLRIAPDWCNEDGTRKTPEQVLEYHSPEKVRERLEKKANPFKWGAAQHNKNTGVNHRLTRTKKPTVDSECKICGITPHDIDGCLVCREYNIDAVIMP